MEICFNTFLEYYFTKITFEVDMLRKIVSFFKRYIAHNKWSLDVKQTMLFN